MPCGQGRAVKSTTSKVAIRSDQGVEKGMDVHQKLRPRCTKGGSRVFTVACTDKGSCGVRRVSYKLPRASEGILGACGGYGACHISMLLYAITSLCITPGGHRLPDICWCRSSAPERDEADEPWPQRTLDSCSTMQLRDVLLLTTIRHSGEFGLCRLATLVVRGSKEMRN